MAYAPVYEEKQVDLVICFFFQAEDGIRDYKVTGVQTCALPIFRKRDEQLLRTEHQPAVSRDVRYLNVQSACARQHGCHVRVSGSGASAARIWRSSDRKSVV